MTKNTTTSARTHAARAASYMPTRPEVHVVPYESLSEIMRGVVRDYPGHVWGCPCGELFNSMVAATRCRKCRQYLAEVPNEVNFIITEPGGVVSVGFDRIGNPVANAWVRVEDVTPEWGGVRVTACGDRELHYSYAGHEYISTISNVCAATHE